MEKGKREEMENWILELIELQRIFNSSQSASRKKRWKERKRRQVKKKKVDRPSGGGRWRR